MHRTAVIVGLVATASLAAALAGCGETIEPTGSTPVSGPIVLVGGDPSSGQDALVSGYLLHDTEHGCLVLSSDPDRPDEYRSPPVFPPGSTPYAEDGALVGVEVAGFGLVRIGQWLQGGGGYNPSDSPDLEGLPALPDGCETEDGYAVLDAVLEVADSAPAGD